MARPPILDCTCIDLDYQQSLLTALLHEEQAANDLITNAKSELQNLRKLEASHGLDEPHMVMVRMDEYIINAYPAHLEKVRGLVRAVQGLKVCR